MPFVFRVVLPNYAACREACGAPPGNEAIPPKAPSGCGRDVPWGGGGGVGGGGEEEKKKKGSDFMKIGK